MNHVLNDTKDRCVRCRLTGTDLKRSCLSDKQATLLRYIRSLPEVPSASQLARHFGDTQPSMYAKRLFALSCKGYIKSQSYWKVVE